MLQEFLYEIIASTIVITIIVIYFLSSRRKQQDVDAIQDSPPKTVKNTTDKEPLIEKKEDLNVEEEPFRFETKDEGSFGAIQSNPFEETPKQNNPRQKIDVPAHDKIVKDDFKEFQGLKILVAEDNIINQKVIKGLLGASGIELTMADDGQIALDILEKDSTYHMVLMDAHMPRVDGFEATRRIRAHQNYEHIVVIALSGDTAPDDVKKMMDSGMEAHLEKPLRMDALYDILYAYTKKSLPDQDSQDQVSDTSTTPSDLNAKDGLDICGGDETFYKDILNEFTQNYAKSSIAIKELLETHKLDAADAMLLDIMGVTANIGAENLQSTALDFKKAIKNKEHTKYNLLLNTYHKHLQALLQKIKAHS